MSARTSIEPFRRALVPLAVLLLAVLACSPRAQPRTSFVWLAGQIEPRFDPTGPPDELRWSLERLLGQGLVAEDERGQVVPAAARDWQVSPDGRTYTFHLRPDLRFANGRRCTSADFVAALGAGLNRVDHSTYAWLLAAVVGIDRVRAGRSLPKLGIEAPDDATVVLKLERPEPTLLDRLAIPGASMPWAPEAEWGGGIGPYRLVTHEQGRRMLLVRAAPHAGPDSLRVEFALRPGVALARMRAGRPDLVWPLPPGLLGLPIPASYTARNRAAQPTRRLWLVMRPDLPPTRKPEARRALAHGLDRAKLRTALAGYGVSPGEALTGGAAVDLPRRDPAQVREWFDRGHLGRAMRVVMAYRADGPAAELARLMQSSWAEQRVDVELRPLRGAALAKEALGRGGAQMLLLEAQPLLADAASEMAMLVLPRRGPPVGSFRTGWSAGDLARWLGNLPADSTVDVNYATQRLGEELVALPLLQMPWCWIERTASERVRFHPHFGPQPGASGAPRPQP